MKHDDIHGIARCIDGPEIDQPDEDEAIRAAMLRLRAAGIDPIIPRRDCLVALNLSAATVSRMQRRAELPTFDEISPGRRGWPKSTLSAVLEGRRDWPRRPQTIASCKDG